MARIFDIISILYQLLFCSHPNSELFLLQLRLEKEPTVKIV